MTQDLILFAYDGSAAARSAIERGAALFPGRDAIVLTVWESAREATGGARAALPDEVIEQAVGQLDQSAEQAASATAEEGAELARRAALGASPQTAQADPSVWSSILREADERGAAAIVIGSRGRSGLRSLLLGSVSTALVHHSRRPVVVVQPDDPED